MGVPPKTMCNVIWSVPLHRWAPDSPEAPFHDWTLQYNQQQGEVWSAVKHCQLSHPKSVHLKTRYQTIFFIFFSEEEEFFLTIFIYFRYKINTHDVNVMLVL